MRIVFHTQKPKARKLAETFRRGCLARGLDFRSTDGTNPQNVDMGIFYGITRETYPTFRYYMAQGRALYLDNGWLSTPDKPTFRFSWNSVQPFLMDLPPETYRADSMGRLPPINHEPAPASALLILQSRQYFDFLRLPYDRDTWQGATTRLLNRLGYTVSPREKPTKRAPASATLFESIERAEIVVSLNSAACLKALCYGVPAFCTLDCSLTPLAPVKIPRAGRAAPPNMEAVRDMRARLASQEITPGEMQSGAALDRILGVKPGYRRGYFYGTD